jgi:murein tripeptide amidase MpaA
MATYLARIVAETIQAAQAIRPLASRLGFELHERGTARTDRGPYRVPAILNDEQVAQVRALGYQVDIVEDLERAAARGAAEVNPRADRFAPAERDRSRDPAAEAPPGQQRLERLMDLSDLDDRGNRAAERTVLGGYLTPDEVESALTTLAAAYPGLAAVEPLPEKSWEGRTSHVLRLRAGGGADRSGVLITGSMHAREWGGSDTCVAFATNLLKAYQYGGVVKYGNKEFGAAEVKSILEKLEVFVFADVNPDGKAFSQSTDPGSGQVQSFWWRKNRNPSLPGGSKGVDLNRNFDFLWSSGIGTSEDPASFTYRGEGAFSEPEARNVRSLFEKYPHLGYFVDVHSFGELILYAWGDDENQTTTSEQNFRNPGFDSVRGIVGDTAYREFIRAEDQSRLVQLAQAMNGAIRAVRGKSYFVQQAVGLYPTSATSDDYSFSRQNVIPGARPVRSFTIEFGQQFVPPYAEMRKVMADVAAALTELCRQAAVS